MSAPKGNQYYLLRSKDGRDRMFETSEELMEACNEYFEWCIKNPLKEQVAFHYQGIVVKDELEKLRAFTLEGLCNFIDITVEGLKKYGEREDFVGVYTRIRQIIYNQKFEGAAAGFLNANIIARDLGLVDKAQTDNTGEVKLHITRTLIK